jgi:hypothetical protein
MTVDGGGWTQMRQAYLDGLSVEIREYLYTYNGAWYISPPTGYIWSWTSYQLVEGTYYYSTGAPDAEGSFSCTDNETGYWGVGCSNGPGNQWKCFVHSYGNKDEDGGQTTICQDQPDVFGVGACVEWAQIWTRP